MKLYGKVILVFLIAACFVGTAYYGVRAAGWTDNGTGAGAGSVSADYVSPGDTNVLLGYGTLTAPNADTLITNGATAVIAAGNSLTAFPTTLYYPNPGGAGKYTDGEALITSSDTILDSDDVVVQSGPLTSFVTPLVGLSTPGSYVHGWVDNVTGNTRVETTEDFIAGLNDVDNLTDGTTIRLFTDAYSLLYDGQGIESSTGNEMIIVSDEDSDGYVSAGDTVIQTADVEALKTFDTSDGVCFDGSISNDSEYDDGEVIWWDAAGDCSSFTGAADIILVGSASPTGTSTEFITEDEIAYLDYDNDGTYDCSEAACETLIGSGATPFSGQVIATTAVFFDSSTEVRGIATLGNGWDESGYGFAVTEDLAQTSGGEALYAYTDDNSNSSYDNNVDHLVVVAERNGTVLANDQTFYTFVDNDYYTIGTGQSSENGWIVGSFPLIYSPDDAVLDVGDLDGGGTDTVDMDSTTNIIKQITTSHATLKFHDHDTSGTFAVGDDIVDDLDSSTIYNGDDLQSLTVGAGAAAYDLENGDFDAIYLYQAAGDECAGDGTDTLIASDSSTPFLSQSYTITMDPFTTGSSAASRTICVYADISASADEGTLMHPAFSSVTFASGAGSSLSFEENEDYISVADSITPAYAVADASPGGTTDMTITFTTSSTVPEGLTYVSLPAGFDATDASGSCVDSEDSTITSFAMAFSSTLFAFLFSEDITASDETTCTISDIVLPSTPGTYSPDTYIWGGSSDNRGMFYYGTSAELTVGSSSTGTLKPEPNLFYALFVTTPAPSAQYAKGATLRVKWSDIGTLDTSYVHLDLSVDDGVSWSRQLTAIEEKGYADIVLPNTDTSRAKVRIVATDLANDIQTFTSATFEIGAGGTDDIGDSDANDAICQDLPSGISVGDYILGTGSSSVFYVGSDCTRHVFIHEKIYFTYQSDFSAVKELPLASVALIPEGHSMLPKPHRVLVKIEETPTVYYVMPDPEGGLLYELVEVETEAQALAYFGADWSAYVIDLTKGNLALFTQRNRTLSEVGLDTGLINLIRRDALRAQ